MGDLKLRYVTLIVPDPVLPPAVKQHGRPTTTRLRSIRDKVVQMANSGKPSHVNANSHSSNDKCAECGLPNSTVLNPENDW